MGKADKSIPYKEVFQRINFLYQVKFWLDYHLPWGLEKKEEL